MLEESLVLATSMGGMNAMFRSDSTYHLRFRILVDCLSFNIFESGEMDT